MDTNKGGDIFKIIILTDQLTSLYLITIKQIRPFTVCINQHLQLCTINIQSTKNKDHIIRDIVDEQNIDIPVISETRPRNRDAAWCQCGIQNMQR